MCKSTALGVAVPSEHSQPKANSLFMKRKLHISLRVRCQRIAHQKAGEVFEVNPLEDCEEDWKGVAFSCYESVFWKSMSSAKMVASAPISSISKCYPPVAKTGSFTKGRSIF